MAWSYAGSRYLPIGPGLRPRTEGRRGEFVLHSSSQILHRSCIPDRQYAEPPPAPFGHPVANSSSGQVRCGLLKQDLASKDGHYLVCNLLNLLIRVRRGRNLWRYDCLRMRVPCATDGIASGNLISPGYSPIRLRDIVFLIRSKCSISSLREDIVVRQCRRSWKPPRSETKLSTYEAVDVKHLVTELQSKTSI